MAIGDDFEIQNDKDVRYTGTTDNYTVLQLHRWLQGLADDASSTGDDYMDITKDTPSDKQFDTIITLSNGYNIDDTAAQHLYGGSIIQSNGDVIYDGIQVLAPAGMRLEIIQNGALATNFWTTGLNADSANGISHQFMIKVRTGGADIDGRRLLGTTREWGKTFLEFKINGTARGVNVMAFTGWADDLNNATSSGTVAGYSDITNLSVGYNGIDVNSDLTDEYYYSEWDRASRTINQFYEYMKYITRRGETATIYGLQGQLFRGITHEINTDTPSATDFSAYEAVSWSGGTGQMLAVNDVNNPTKMWIQLLTGVAPTNNQTITGGSSGATCLVDTTVTERTVSTPFCGQSTGSTIIGAYGFGIQAADLTASDKVFDLTNTLYQAPNYQSFTVGGLTSGEDYVLVAPLGYKFDYDNEGGTPPFVVDETLTFTSPAGTAKLIALTDNGSTGSMTIRMLTGTVPTNNSTISGGTSGATADVNGTVSPTVDIRQFTLNGALTGAAVTSVVVTEAIPSDTPSSGTLRIARANGSYTKHPYSAYNAGTKTFTITSHDFSSINAANGANTFCSYIDALCDATSEAYTAIYSSDRSLFIRVRDGGVTPIKTFESTGTFGSAGGSATAVRTSDA